MVMVIDAYYLDSDGTNELYAFNGISNYYRDRSIPIYQNPLIRLYILNMIEFDPAITFHIHVNMFHPHQDYINEHICLGFFDVIREDA